jgi:hypothetical protein
MFIGDLNYDMLVSDTFSPLQNVCDIFDFTNLVKSSTCYTKNSNPRLNSNFLFLSHGKSDRTYAAIPLPWAVRSALQEW